MCLSSLLALACAGCISAPLRSTLLRPPTPIEAAELWEEPHDLAARNLFDGPWKTDLAPNPAAIYTFVSQKTVGISPGFAVTDEHGTEWSVKQGLETRVEVVTSRVLSAVGYHQPPVYYLAKWTIAGGPSPGGQPEGRFRPKHSVLKDGGEWSWQENPFVGTRPFNGLRVLMLILNESDLKNSNNSLYAVKGTGSGADAPHQWYVVRDIGTALGETGRLNPKRNDPELFERNRFITGFKKGEVQFNYRGRHQELADHISPEDVRWMCDLLGQLSLEQWQDAFRAGGYDEATAARFIARIRGKIAEGQAVAQGSTIPKPVAGIHELRDKYVWSTLGIGGAVHATVTSSLEQWRRTPPEWRSDATGYTKRWVSDYAESAIGSTAKYAVARLFHQDPSFARCECTGFARRLLHAIDSPFMARRSDGARVPSAASLAGFLTGHVVSAATWYPAPLGSRDGLRHAGLSLLTKIGMDVFHEFADRSR
jgi:hypothetical protein